MSLRPSGVFSLARHQPRFRSHGRGPPRLRRVLYAVDAAWTLGPFRPQGTGCSHFALLSGALRNLILVLNRSCPPTRRGGTDQRAPRPGAALVRAITAGGRPTPAGGRARQSGGSRAGRGRVLRR